MSEIIDKMLLHQTASGRRFRNFSSFLTTSSTCTSCCGCAFGFIRKRNILLPSSPSITFLSHTLLFQPHSSSQTKGNRSVISFLLSFLFFFSRLFILIIFISLPGAQASLPSLPSLHRLYRAYVLFVV